jgi:hypothetical protein
MIAILVAKEFFLIIMDKCNYKPYSCLKQMAKDNQLRKTPHGMYNRIGSYISLVIARILHLLISCRTM